MMSCGLDYSCTTNENLQYVTVVIACRQMSVPITMLHGTLSYGRQMRYEFLICCEFEIFVALRLFVDCSEIFSPGPYY